MSNLIMELGEAYLKDWRAHQERAAANAEKLYKMCLDDTGVISREGLADAIDKVMDIHRDLPPGAAYGAYDIFIEDMGRYIMDDHEAVKDTLYGRQFVGEYLSKQELVGYWHDDGGIPFSIPFSRNTGTGLYTNKHCPAPQGGERNPRLLEVVLWINERSKVAQAKFYIVRDKL